MYKIVLSHALCDEGMKLLLSQKDVEVVVANKNNPEEILEYLTDADAFLLRIGSAPASLISKCPKLKVITRPGVGTDTIDVDYATEHGIPVVITPGANSRSVAEHALMFLLVMAKNYTESYEESKKGNYSIRNKYSAFEIEGKTLGVFGFGHVGRITAQLASAIGMKIAVYDPFVSEEAVKKLDYTFFRSLDSILPVCDAITLHMASNDKTRGMFTAKEFSKMKKGALIVNCARGDLIVESDLYEALLSKQIGAAAEDMMINEPFDLNNPLFSLSNFIVSPHMAALTVESAARCAVMAVEGTLAVLRKNQWKYVFDSNVYQHEIWKK